MMQKQPDLKVSKLYLGAIILLMLILPLVSAAIDSGFFKTGPGLLLLTGKWFVFWGIGVRLFTAGLRQVLKPGFTAQEIFHIKDIESQLIVRELGFANICFGLTGIIALFIPAWLTAAAFTGGLYMGIAGFYHIIKKQASPNEVAAMVSDLFIFAVMAVYVWLSF